MISTKRCIDGGYIQCFGSLDAKDLLLFVGRDNIAKDNTLLQSLVEHFATDQMTVIVYEPISHATVRAFGLGEHWRWIPRPLHTVIKGLRLLSCPPWWGYFRSAYREECQTIAFRCDALKRFIQMLGADKNITIISRSAGGRVSSLIADELGIKRLVCLGYPFKHPDKPLEPERFAHLATLKTPFLILQGIHDAYGGLAVKETYPLSHNVSLEFIETDHDYVLTRTAWDTTVERIRAFIFTGRTSAFSPPMPIPTQKELAITFLQLVSAGKITDAYTHVSPTFRHHNPYFPGDAASLANAMEENAKQYPNKSVEIKHVLEDGFFVAIHSRVKLDPDGPEMALFHLFRFEDARITELWDIGQAAPSDSPNQHGLF